MALRSTNETKWLKFQKYHDFAFLGRDVIATASGIFVSFFDLTTKQKRIERFDDKEKGDGASCLAGHPVVAMFSVVTRDVRPKISVFTYPAMRKVSCCTDKSTNGYLSTVFAGTDYLLSLTTFPDFRMIVWLWKTGEKMCEIETKLNRLDTDSVKISCSPCNSPQQFLSTFSPSSGKISVYRLHVCSKIVKLSRVEITEAEEEEGGKIKIESFSWSSNGNLFVCDQFSNVWLVSMETDKWYPIVKSNSSGKYSRGRKPLITSFQCGIITVTQTTYSEITYYRKSLSSDSSYWKALWTIQRISHPVRMKEHPQRNSILFQSEKGEISEISWMQCDVECNSPKVELIFDDDHGIKYETLCLISPEELRRIAVIDEFFCLRIIDISTGKLISNTLHLKHHGPNSHPFLSILATSSIKGNCLFIPLESSSSVKIYKCIHLQRDPLEKLKFSSEGCLVGVGALNSGRIFFIDIFHGVQVLGLLKIDNQRIDDFLIYDQGTTGKMSKILVLVRDKVIIYTHRFQGDFHKEVDYVLRLPNRFLSLEYGVRRNLDILGAPYLSKQLHMMEIKNNFHDIALREAVTSMHRLRKIGIATSTRYVLTYGYDGLIVIRRAERLEEIVGFLMAHHRQEAGIKAAILSGEFIISLGRNGDLVGMKLSRIETSPTEETLEYFGRPKLDEPLYFTFDNIKEIREEEEKAETWVESVNNTILKKEKGECSSVRDSILKDFKQLKDQVTDLLESNEKESPDAHLPISSFDLNQEDRKRRIGVAKIEREKLENELEERIARQDQIASYLRKTFWNRMRVHSCVIKSIFNEIKVFNYPLPWVPGEPVDTKNLDDDCIRKDFTCRDREYQMKIHFNEMFEEMRSLKKREIESAVNRVDKLHQCASELNALFGMRAFDETIRKPEWHCDEIPEYVVTVRDEELTKKRLFLADAKKVNQHEDKEKENRDDFRESILMKMMDGTLEIRWEDEIKKDIPKLECLTKDTSDLTEEDLKVIESYERKVKILEEERRKRKVILENEILQLKEDFWKDINAFNEKLKDLALKRIQVQSSILQEKLSRHRMRKRHDTKLKKEFEIIRIKTAEIPLVIKGTRRISDIYVSLEETINELKNRYEILCKREKLLEGKFRLEFADMKQPMVEHLFRHYKRRPRAGRFTCTSIIYLTEVGTCLMNREKSDILPKECLDFLRGMDGLDVMPGTLPAQIDVDRWRTMCRLRRIKIETEMKVRSCAIQLADAEQTSSFYQKVNASAQNKLSHWKNVLESLEKSYVDFINDTEVQVVMQTGQIEVPLEGSITDFQEPILIQREELVRVNKAISEAAKRKLTAMRQSIDLRKLIFLEEWKHECARTTIKDLEEDLRTLQAVRITKDVQKYLNRLRLRTGTRDIDYERSEKIVETIKKSYQNKISKEDTRLRKAFRLTNYWKREERNINCKIESFNKQSLLRSSQVQTKEASSKRHDQFCQRKLSSLMKRTRLVKRIRDNYENLLSLHAHLQVLKLRIYPTLKLRRKMIF